MKINKVNAKIESECKKNYVESREKELASLSSINNLYDFINNNQIRNREIRSPIGLSNSSESQFERHCRNVGSQPCTCYHPDHVEVVHFEVGNDTITKNAFKADGDGTGPSNCSDLKAIGYSLRGFYLVLLNNTKRTKPTYCDFNQINNSTNLVEKLQASSLNQIATGPSTVRRIKFCGGLVRQQCTFYYADHPDAATFQPRSNNTEPTSCSDLKLIGHSLNGYYMVRINVLRVKTVYCNFQPNIVGEDEKKKKTKRATVTQKYGTQQTLCNGVGSQPCSCYHSKFANIQQLELSSDNITRNASSENGEGPTSCKDYEIIGHILKGFYIVRFNGKTMKSIFCEFKPATKMENVQINPKGVPTAKTLVPSTGKINGQMPICYFYPILSFFI